MNDLKKLEGQPWSSYLKLLEGKKNSVAKHDMAIKPKASCVESATCMKLPRADMAIYGLCPKTEVFELVVCNHCGYKLKLPAFAEHIRLRHSDDGASPTSIKCDKSERCVQKKGQTKKTKEKEKAKPKEKPDTLVKTILNVDFMEIVSDKQSLPLESEIVSKCKTMSIKCKTSTKNTENDSSKEDPSEKGNCSDFKSESKNDISCNSSHNNSTLRAQLKVDVSTIAQEGELINMQPIVQLTPLPARNTSDSTVVNFRIIEDKGKTENHCQTNIINNNNTNNFNNSNNNHKIINSNNNNSNVLINNNNNKDNINSLNNNNNEIIMEEEKKIIPDLHCRVINKENSSSYSKPFTSLHSLPLKRTALDKNKKLDIRFILDKNKKLGNEISHVNELQPSITIDRDKKPCSPSLTRDVNSNTFIKSSTTSLLSSALSTTLSSSSSVHIEKTDLVNEKKTDTKVDNRVENNLENKLKLKVEIKTDCRPMTRAASHRPRLSLPVSIKNPSILCQLQNKVTKSKLRLPIESLRNENIQDVIKENFVQKQLRNIRAYRTSKENSRSQRSQKKEGESDSSNPSKTEDLKREGLEQWRLGFRRTGGLLYSNPNVPPPISRTSVIHSTPPLPIPVQEHYPSVVQQTRNSFIDRNEIIDLCGTAINRNDLTKYKLDVESKSKKPTSSVMPKQKAPSLGNTNSTKSNNIQPKNYNNSPVSNNHSKTVICKRSNNNINGAIPAKVKKQEGFVSYVGPVYGKNEHTVPLMQLEVPNNIFEKQIITPAQNITPPNTIDVSTASIQAGANARGSPLRIGSPRIHYITASGPLPVNIQQVASVPQLQIKPVRVQHKYHLVTPQISLSPTSLFYIQKTATNSSSMNGLEER